MTRKDFELIAECVSDFVSTYPEMQANPKLALHFARFLRRTNGRFDADRFVRACEGK